MFRAKASISSRSASLVSSVAALTRARRYGWVATTSSSVRRASPWTMRRRLPSGSLNILWMWVAVPTGYRSACAGSSTEASRCVNTAMSLPFAMASSIRRTELSRATARGMKEFGKRTVSRSGKIGSSDGIEGGRWPFERSSGLRLSVGSLMANLSLLRIEERNRGLATRHPSAIKDRNQEWGAGGGGTGSATGGAQQGRRSLHVQKQ